MLNRRELMQRLGMAALLSGAPGLALCRADTDARLVLVVLRGAVDGLAIAAPYGDGKYRRLRGELALEAPGEAGNLLPLDGMFGLHPALANVHRLFASRQALIVHAVASPYRERSHFDGQDVLESGAARVGDLRDGWLNRAIAALDGRTGDATAIALAANTPLILRGAHSVSSWAPSQLPDADDDTLRRIQALYANDEFFATRLEQALASQEIAAAMGDTGRKHRGNEAAQGKALMEAAARFLTAPDGPAIAVLEAGGWDTHANQGAASGALATRLRGLDEGLAALQAGMGTHWSRTVVAVVTEFGRTVAVNGTRGTDHGTATAALLLGGALDGGRVIADWPGLAKSELFEGRDLYPTTDLRSVFKTVLADHLLVPANHIERNVFPDSAAARPIDNLIRA